MAPPPAGMAVSTEEERWPQRQFSMSVMEAGVGVEGGGGGGWERWDRWRSSERHACAAVLVRTRASLCYLVVIWCSYSSSWSGFKCPR